MKRPTSNVKTAQEAGYISDAEAAEMIGVARGTLKNWRTLQKENQPPFYKREGGCTAVRYKAAEVDAWIKSHRREF